MAVPKGVLDAIRRAIARREAQLQGVVGQVSNAFDRLRRSLMGEIGALDTIGLTRMVNRLIELLRSQTQTFERDVNRAIQDAEPGLVVAGQAVVDDPLVAAGLAVSAPDVTIPLLEALEQFRADRITNLSASMIDQISLELRLGAMGTKSVFDVIQSVASKLRTADAGDAGFGSLAARGEAIVRTELGRIHSMATQRRMEQAVELFPDLMKEWRHSGNLLHPRDGHQALSGTRVPVKAKFMVAPTVGGSREAMWFPHDPAASARNTVRCRCTCVPWRASWA